MNVRFEQISTLDWNINSSYSVGTKVKYNGKCYLSKKDVPVGINIGMGDYWKKLVLADDVSELAGDVETLETKVGVLESGLGGLTTRVTTLESEINYSVEELKCGTFNDGVNVVDIYKKTIDVGALPNATIKEVEHGITDLGLILQVYGSAHNTDGTTIPIPDATITPNPTYNENTNILLRINKTYIEITTRVDRSAFSGYVTLVYTKEEAEEEE